ncbi:MAG TPA: hypothetical protein VGK36_01025 [Candidatus Angelobacter sp.]|jgi:hypothetical protein
MPKTIQEQLTNYGVSLHELFVDLPQHSAITDTLDYILGALYALSRAHDLGFRDRKSGHLSSYRPNLAKYALSISKSENINRRWMAGFYFNSSIQRIAAAFDRLPQMLKAKMEKRVAGKRKSTSARERMAEVNSAAFAHWQRVYDEVNAFKHSPEGRADGRTVLMDDALLAFQQMLGLIATSKPTLKSLYK